MSMVGTSGAGDDPPSPSDKRSGLDKCFSPYRNDKKKNKNNGSTEGEQEERRKKRGGILHLLCFKPSTLDDETTREDQRRRNTELPGERRQESAVTLEGGLDKNTIRVMTAAVLSTRPLRAVGSTSSAGLSRRTVTLRGGVPARLYNPTTLSEPSSSNVPHASESSDQHGKGSAQPTGLRCEVAGCSKLKGSCPRHDDKEPTGLRCEVASCSNLKGSCPQHDDVEEGSELP